MKSCLKVHVYWSSHRVPICNVLIHRVPVEFPITFLGISFQSIFLFTRVSKIETTKRIYKRLYLNDKIFLAKIWVFLPNFVKLLSLVFYSVFLRVKIFFNSKENIPSYDKIKKNLKEES